MKVINDIYEVVRNIGSVSFTQPLWLWLALAVLVIIPFWKKLGRALPNTFVAGHSIRSVGWPGWATTGLLAAAWIVLSIAAAGPQLATTENRDSYKAREFQILIDSSGSMFSSDVDDEQTALDVRAWEATVFQKSLDRRAQFPMIYPVEPQKPAEVREGEEGKIERFALARYAAAKFVQSRIESSKDALKRNLQGDRVGIGTFSDDVFPAYPLTSELSIPLKKIEQLFGVTSGGGTNFEGPTPGNPRIGAFQYSINEFKRWGLPSVKTKVMILVSDGDAGISPERHQKLVEAMKSQNLEIHVYALVCGAKTQVDNESTKSVRKLIAEVNPDDALRPEFKNAVIWAGDGIAMQNAFDLINRLEKSVVEGEPVLVNKDVRRQFILLGSLLGGLFLVAAAYFRENL